MPAPQNTKGSSTATRRSGRPWERSQRSPDSVLRVRELLRSGSGMYAPAALGCSPPAHPRQPAQPLVQTFIQKATAGKFMIEPWLRRFVYGRCSLCDSVPDKESRKIPAPKLIESSRRPSEMWAIECFTGRIRCWRVRRPSRVLGSTSYAGTGLAIHDMWSSNPTRMAEYLQVRTKEPPAFLARGL